MTLISNLLNTVGIVFLIHAVYSSYEHSLLDDIALSISTTTTTSQRAHTLPTDIVAELLISVFLICVGIVAGSAKLKPIKWNLWAGELERSKDARKVTAFGEGGGNPFARLEDRVGFLDVRSARGTKR